MTERAVVFGPERALVGVVTEPEGAPDLPVVLLLNAGMLPRMGPNRLYVRLARRLAALGYRVLRFDFSGIGDSPASASAAPFEERALEEAGYAMDFLAGSAATARFIPMGVCSGADVAWALALADPRVVGAGLINGGFIDAERARATLDEAQARVEARYYRSRLFDPRSWARLLSGRSDWTALRRALGRTLGRADAESAAPHGPRSDLDALLARGTRLLAVYSEGSITWDLLEVAFGPHAKTLAAYDNVDLDYVSGCDHVFTPVSAQAALLDRVSEWATAARADWAAGSAATAPGPGA